MMNVGHSETHGALEGLRVLDASQMMAGPLCALRLGDLGADVLKIEPPRGEWTRTHAMAGAAIEGETTALLGMNRNKRSVVIDLKAPGGREVLERLVRESDVFLQNFRVGTAERLGVGPDALRTINPRLIYCSISGYGPTGPYAARPGQDLVIQGYSGSMWSVGRAEDPPTPSALWAADALAGYQAAIGILSAVIARARTGRGQHVEVNLLAATLDCQLQELTTYLNLGIAPERRAEPTAHAFIPAPYGVYQTSDGWMTLAMSPLPVLGDVLDEPRLRELTAWDDGSTHADEVYAIVRPRMLERTTAEWFALLDAAGLWAGPVHSYADVAADEHIRETGMIATVEHPTIGPLRMPAPPLSLSETPTSIALPPPLLDEHTDEVLREVLDLGDEELASLRASGAIGTGREVAL
jgi:crotonobetainyl-CoA:carnitine CoA-transferase CaiB-like acyl-CoA transferase